MDGEITSLSLSSYEGKYVVLFFYPKDFTFVCPTEIIAFSDRAKEFEALNAQVIAASTDTPEVHLAWIKTARRRGGLGHVQIPIVADVRKEVSASFGVLSAEAGVAYRGLFIINPEGVIQHITMNDFPIGRNVDEALRTLEAIRFVAEHGEVCPAGWKPGSKTMTADPEKSLEYFETLKEDGAEGEEGKEEGEEGASGSSAITAVHDKRGYEALISSGKVVVKYWAPWCGKCRMIAPTYEDLAVEAAAKNAEVTFASFDTTEEKLEDLASDVGVKAMPQFRFFKDGQEVLKPVTGYKKAPLKDSVQQLIEL